MITSQATWKGHHMLLEPSVQPQIQEELSGFYTGEGMMDQIAALEELLRGL